MEAEEKDTDAGSRGSEPLAGWKIVQKTIDVPEAAKKMPISEAASRVLSDLPLLAEIRAGVRSTEDIVGVLCSRAERASFAAKCRTEVREYDKAREEKGEAERLWTLAAAVLAITSLEHLFGRSDRGHG